MLRPVIWPLVIVLSAAAAGLATLTDAVSPVRPALVLWFILVCPGMAFVRLLRLKDVLTELTLAIALSLVLSTIVSEVILYLQLWSPLWALFALIALALIGADLQLIQVVMRTRQPVRENG